jgi:2',3'-cyclic-nucleotide 2'-phosphodiesterase (5'-nucleotidase family)
MGYDAVTIGNHETDLGPAELASFITAAQANAMYPFSIPIVASNMNPNTSTAINTLLSNGTIVKSLIITKAGIKIGILGQLGPNADFDSPNAAPLTFDHSYADLQAQVNALRANGAQLVVLLSHEGFKVSGGYAIGNDALIADNVSGIDVILSGHLHINQTAVKTSANTNNTILVEPGQYGEYIARLDLKVDKTTGKINSYTSTNVLIDDTINGNLWMNNLVNQVNSSLNTALVPAFNGLFGSTSGVSSILDTVAINDAPITQDSITSPFTVGESVLGNLAADSYRNAINGIWAEAYVASGGNVTVANATMAAATGDANLVQIGFVPGGIIRDPLAVEAGTISFADLYAVLPLGGDPSDSSALGYPLLTTYIKAADIYTIVGISLSMGMDLAHSGLNADSDYYINFAGIYVKVYANHTHSLTGLGYDVYLCPTDTNTSSPNYGMNGNIPGAGTFINPTNTTTLYKISTDLYTLMMMYEVENISSYTVNTYDAAGNLLPQYGAVGNRVYTSASGTTLRGWQSIEAWSWAASLYATSYLSNAGYTSAAPSRVKLLP